MPGISLGFKTISWEKGKVKLIDQSKLPARLKYVYFDKMEDLCRAIKELRVRGAPALGAAGALAVYLGVKDFSGNSLRQFRSRIKSVSRYVASSRPTARNLFWGIERASLTGLREEGDSVDIESIKNAVLNEALEIIRSDQISCDSIGRFGSSLVKDRWSILTICNAGMLATCGIGTALGILYCAKSDGKAFNVYASETRPLLQGSRLTSWELSENGIDATIICDNTAGMLLKSGKIDCVITGADRIASNGDTANKIGTYNLAVLSRYHNVPFYVAAPVSTFDLSLKTGDDIIIEDRDSSEVTFLLHKKRVAPEGIKVLNPAFDITPNSLITAIITDAGIIRMPYKGNIRKALC